MSDQRIRVVGGPWPERIGCEGRIVTHELDRRIYPRHGMGKGETIIRLDDDPLHRCGYCDARWTCVIDAKDVEPVGEGL
jgi:hypothetical protein